THPLRPRTGSSSAIRRCTRRRRADEVEGALEGGARVCGDEAEVRICEATLSRTEEECHPTVRGVRAGESVLGAEKTVALGTGLARYRKLLITGEPPKPAEDRKKPNPSACTVLAEHLLPRRHGLIQSFPNVDNSISRNSVSQCDSLLSSRNENLNWGLDVICCSKTSLIHGQSHMPSGIDVQQRRF